MKILVPLAEGFEEIEAITIIDTLRRAGIEVYIASLLSGAVTGSHKVSLVPDGVLTDSFQCDGIVLPGGMPGSTNLKKDSRVIKLLKEIREKGGHTAAIYAAPIVLAEAGLLEGKKYTCYPGYEEEIKGGFHLPEPVVVDGNVITGKGAACALPFALKIVEYYKGAEASLKLKEQMMAFW